MITVIIGTNKFQKGDFSKHKDFNLLIHKVYNNEKEWKNSDDYPKNKNIIAFSEEEINKIKSSNSYCNDDNNWK